MPTKVPFKLHGVGEIPADYAARVLFCVNSAYDGLLVFDQLNEMSPSRLRDTTLRLRDYWVDPVNSIALSLPAISNALELRSVVLQSPGFWEFVGSLNPLEALRKYLTDRHERNKDISYRSQAEAEKLNIDNALLKVKLVSETVDACRKAGLTEQEIRALVRDFVQIPLLKLESLQDKGVISYAEIPNDQRVDVSEEVDA